MRAIPTSFVKANDILAEDVYTVDGKTLLKAGASLTDNLISRIEANKVFTVYIQDIHSDKEIQRIIDPHLRHKGYAVVKNIFDLITHRDKNGQLDPQSIFEEYHDLTALADDIIYEMGGQHHKQLEHIDIKSLENYLYGSALNVAILSLMLAFELDMPTDMLKEIFVAGIFHDIGMAMLPKELLQKSEAFTLPEKKLIISHPIMGHKYLKEHAFLSAYVKVACLQHHEHLDGTGYPLRKSKEELNLVSQIVGIADIFDAMTSDRPYRKAKTPNEAIEYLMGVAGRHYDYSLINKFVQKVNPYPVGAHVKLNTGDIAVVDAVHKQLPLRPIIRIIHETKDGFDYEEVDLRNNTNIVIESIHY